MKHLILASTSPRRKMILEGLGLPFEVIPSEYEEDNTLAMLPPDLVAYLARGKASSVAEQYPEAVVIGSDTLVALDGQVFGKPADKQDIIRMLNALSGRVHAVFSGLAVIEGGHITTDSVETKVFFKRLTPQEIEAYAEHYDEWHDKAGGYAVQGLAGIFIDKIEGDYNSLIGLPVRRLAERLGEFGVKVL